MNMKRLVMALTALVLGTGLLTAQESIGELIDEIVETAECGQDEDKDEDKDGDRNEITLSDGKVHLDFDIPFYDRVSKKKVKGAVDPLTFMTGVLMTNAPQSLDFNPYNSLEISFYLMDNIWTRGRSAFHWGVGMGWKNFAITSPRAMMVGEDGKILTGSYPEGSTHKLSKLTVYSVSFPILYTCSFANGVGFSMGPVLNINGGASIKNKYKDAKENKQKDKYKDVHANMITADLMFQLNFNGFGLYVKYSPMELMDTAYWPAFRYISLGIGF